MIVPLSLCIGFMLAVLYIDLMFDLLAQPHRRSQGPLPKDVLESITRYYGRITQNPYVLMFVMVTATGCLVAGLVFKQVPPWAGYSSLLLMALNVAVAATKVIPAAQRLGSDAETDATRTRLIHGMLPYHLVLLGIVVAISIIQFTTAR